MRFALVLLVACNSPNPAPLPAPAPHAGAAPLPIDAPACLPRGKISTLLDGSHVRYCTREDGRTRERRCVEIDRDGNTKRLPDDEWPADAQPGVPEVIAPEGWTAKTVNDENDRVVAIEACQGATCTQVPLVPAKNLELDDMIATIAIAPNGKTIAIDRGMETMSRSRLEIHSLAPAKLLRELKLPRDGCTNVAGFAGDYVVVQGIFDCVNLGGTRALATLDGKIVKTLATGVAAGAAYANVGGTKWAFALEDGVEVWDLAPLKRTAKNAEVWPSFKVATGDNVIFTVEHEGKLTRYDADLKALGTTTIALCGS